jgi:hypothetical protein
VKGYSFWWFGEWAHLVPPVDIAEEDVEESGIVEPFDWLAVREQLWAEENGFTDKHESTTPSGGRK